MFLQPSDPPTGTELVSLAVCPRNPWGTASTFYPQVFPHPKPLVDPERPENTHCPGQLLCGQIARLAKSPAGDRREVLGDQQRSRLWAPHPPLPTSLLSWCLTQILNFPVANLVGLFWLYVTEVNLKIVLAKRCLCTGRKWEPHGAAWSQERQRVTGLPCSFHGSPLQEVTFLPPRPLQSGKKCGPTAPSCRPHRGAHTPQSFRKGLSRGGVGPRPVPSCGAWAPAPRVI